MKKNLAKKVISFPLVLAGIFYTSRCVYKTIDINEAIQPLREEFIETVRNSPAKVVKTIDGEVRKLDYGGKLDYLVEKRKEYLKGKGCVAFDWSANDNKIPGNCYVICLNPFAKFSLYKEKN